MKKLIVSFFTLILFSSNIIAKPNFPKELRVPGGVAILNIASKTKPTVTFQDVPVVVVPCSKNPQSQWHPIVGLPLNLKPGTHRVKVYEHGKLIESILFEVKDKDYPKQYVTIPKHKKEKVTPKKSSYSRIAKEQKLLKEKFLNYREESLENLQLKLPLNGRISGAFGLKRIFNGKPRNAHKGLDFAAEQGTPVYTPLEGTVTLNEDLFYTGKTVVIDHGQGYQTLYAHLDRVVVNTGQKLVVGEVLGTVGQSGRASGPHLHLGVNLNGVRVDPELFIAVSKKK